MHTTNDPTPEKLVRVQATGFINRADGTKEAFTFLSEPMTEEEAKETGAVPQPQQGV